MPEAEYSHILSFCGEVYIAPSEVTIPDTTTLSCEGTTYRIFLSTDSINCSYCQQPGHSQTQCSNKAPPTEENTNRNTAQQSAPTPQSNKIQETPSTQSSDPAIPKSTTENNHQPPKPADKNLHPSTNQQVKRQLPISPEITESNTINFCQTTVQTKNRKTSGHLDELLESASDFINSSQNTTILNTIADFIENAQKSKDIIATSRNYIDNLLEIETNWKKTNNNKPSGVLVRFHSTNTKELIYDKKKLLKGTGLVIKEDLTENRVKIMEAAVDKTSLKIFSPFSELWAE
nr:unnamed protein product [Callosobruchus analis]